MTTVFGTVTNLLSLSYFITQRNFNTRNSNTEVINNRLFIVLNVFDILVCVFLSAYVLVGINEYGSTVHSVCLGIFVVANQTTGFITCLLSVIRAISIIRPRHQLNVKVLIGAMITYSIMMLYLNMKFFEENTSTTTVHFSIYTGLFIVVILSNILCIAKLTHSKVASWKREATITMGILSAVYCIFNIGFQVYYGLFLFKCGLDRDIVCTLPIFEGISIFILLPMNSASNPVVYFLRNREMRRYLKNVWRKMTCRRSEQEMRSEQVMTISNIAPERTEVTIDRDGAD